MVCKMLSGVWTLLLRLSGDSSKYFETPTSLVFLFCFSFLENATKRKHELIAIPQSSEDSVRTAKRLLKWYISEVYQTKFYWYTCWSPIQHELTGSVILCLFFFFIIISRVTFTSLASHAHCCWDSLVRSIYHSSHLNFLSKIPYKLP